MRQVVLDTETTGLRHEDGHRIIEIGCVELIDRRQTGRTFHAFLNPERAVDEGAFRVHGISTESLLDKPLFVDIVQEFIDFIIDSELIIHNAVFDVGFINAELSRIKWPHLLENYCQVCDTLVMAREKYRGQSNKLDALCKRLHIDNSKRVFHGALLDAEILAAVYLGMTSGQGVLFEETVENTMSHQDVGTALRSTSPVIDPSPEELEQHYLFLKHIIKKSGINRFELSED